MSAGSRDVEEAGGRPHARLPVTLVTGFLGSGKTTMINAALKAPELRNTVVVINEFGEVGIDHSLVANSNDSVVVLENGCLCCTVRSDLVSTLNDLYQSRMAGRIPTFDSVVIETSGLAEPGPVLQALVRSDTAPEIREAARAHLTRRLVEPLAATLTRRGVDRPQLHAEVAVAALVGVLLSRALGSFDAVASVERAELVELLTRMIPELT